MRVLYIGGSGEISFDCIRESVALGHDVSVFNRGHHNAGLPEACRFLNGDVNDDAAYARLAAQDFDAICQFRLFEPDAIRRDLAHFTGHCGQYVFISTASAYQKPVRSAPTTEHTPLENPYWDYSRKKAEMEAILSAQDRLPYTIVRPSHTYRTRFTTPMGSGIEVSRMLRGKPVVVPNDGDSLWTVTHAEDFARPFARLLGRPAALGEAFHITADQAWTWNEILRAVANAIGVNDAELIYVPAATLIHHRPQWRGPMLGDKCAPAIFDNSKVKSVVGAFPTAIGPWEGMRLVAERYPPSDAIDPEIDAMLDRIVGIDRGGAE